MNKNITWADYHVKWAVQAFIRSWSSKLEKDKEEEETFNGNPVAKIQFDWLKSTDLSDLIHVSNSLIKQCRGTYDSKHSTMLVVLIGLKVCYDPKGLRLQRPNGLSKKPVAGEDLPVSMYTLANNIWHGQVTGQIICAEMVRKKKKRDLILIENMSCFSLLIKP